ncbi:hypothetical protein [Frankia sp. R82]|uniref:hypothetical protein n=1 Tax=Frankia sp. R82 TaxID=2950553 RepID=UPI0020431D3D|nr:hypothetical protein [Frankia sp. R82]MCM3887459.1 hypothetical protein [Frankia sp. R82]
MVAGDAYLAGPARHGVDTNTPVEFVAVLTGAAPVLAQTRSRRQPTWASAAETVNTAYGEPFDTYATALLALEQPDTLEVRVIPVGEA